MPSVVKARLVGTGFQKYLVKKSVMEKNLLQNPH